MGTNPINAGDTAWVLVSAALVLLMTAPGLALFYGGMVRRKNVLGVLMQCFISLALISPVPSAYHSVRVFFIPVSFSSLVSILIVK